MYDGQLRYFFYLRAIRVLTPSEVASEAVANAQEAQQTAAAAQQTAAAAELRAAKLTEQLKTLGVEPEA